MRVALFYDGKNFYSGWKQKSRSNKLDFNKLTDWLLSKVGGNTHVGSHYYTGVEPLHSELVESQGRLEKFLSFIEVQRGFFVHRYARKPDSYVCTHCGHEGAFTREKEVDTSLVADMVKLAALDAYDVAVLLSGDSDYVPAIGAVQSLGKHVFVATWSGAGLSPRIRTAAFDHINLSEGEKLFTWEGPGEDEESPAGDSLSTTDEQEFLNELEIAEEHFCLKRPGSTHDGYVGLGFFVSKWRSEKLTALPEERSILLNRLEKRGDVEVYDAPDGKKAIRIVRASDDDDEEEEFDIRKEWEEEEDSALASV